MNEWIKPYVLRLFWMTFVLFVVNKLVLRPLLLDSDVPEILKSFTLSIPNTCEAIFGVSLITGFLVTARHRLSPRFNHTPDPLVYLLATVLAGIYVLTQEFKFHNLGGNNTYDPYDVVASIIGLVGMFLVLSRFGFEEG